MEHMFIYVQYNVKIITSGAVFTLMSLVVICIATTSLVQLHTRILDKFLPSTSPQKDVEETVEDEEVMKTVKQFRYR